MGLMDIGKSHQQTRDSIGSRPSILGVYKVKTSNVFVELGPVSMQQETEGHGFILGSSTNGLLGINTGTQDGSQQVLGNAGQVDTIVRVLNVNDKFIERFNFDKFNSGSTTADWQTANSLLDMTSAEVVQSLSIALGEGTVANATLRVTGTDATANVAWQLSADGGSNFENVTPGTNHVFTNTGSDLRFKGTASGNATVTLITVEYNV